MLCQSMPMRAGASSNGGQIGQLLGHAGQVCHEGERGLFAPMRHVFIGLTIKSVQLHAQVVKSRRIDIHVSHRQIALAVKIYAAAS